LILGTYAENWRDQLIDGTNKNVKLTMTDVQKIRASKEPDETLADWYDVKPLTIRSVRERKTWKWVK
jgi:hypothetical protein